jgi:hypothetical protein
MRGPSRNLRVFATKKDWLDIFEEISQLIAVKFIVGGRLIESISVYHDLKNIPDIGNSSVGQEIQQKRYLCIRAEVDINFRIVHQRNGLIAKIIDITSNPKAVEINFGGSFGDNTLISGNVSTASADTESQSLFSIVKKNIKKKFQLINSNYLGPEADFLFQSGWRLTSDVRQSRDYDLQYL